MLSSGEKLSKRPPFIFRAHQPLLSANKNFQFKPVNEMERIGDEFKKRETFETDTFSRDMFTKKDIHRSTAKSRWISPKGFVPAKPHLVPVTARDNSYNQNLSIDPYEDPKLDPGFVRSEKNYLRDAHIKSVHREVSQRNNMSTFDSTSVMNQTRTINLNKSLDGTYYGNKTQTDGADGLPNMHGMAAL